MLQVIWTVVLSAALIWVFWRIHLQDKKPWERYKWAQGPLPSPNASMMQHGLVVEATKKRRRNAVVVYVRELQPGDVGWIHEDFIRSFGGHLWLHELGRVTSRVRRHNAGFVEIEVDEDGILVNAPERVPEMTEEEQGASEWYCAMRFMYEDDEEDGTGDEPEDEEEEDEGSASS